MTQLEHGTADQWIGFFTILPPLLVGLVCDDVLELAVCSGRYRSTVARDGQTDAVIEAGVRIWRRIRNYYHQFQASL